MLDPESGQTVQVCEYWDDTTCRFYRQNGVSGSYAYFDYPEVGQELRHGLGAVPFIPFYNNADRMGDLPLYRDLIDAYDKVVSASPTIWRTCRRSSSSSRTTAARTRPSS